MMAIMPSSSSNSANGADFAAAFEHSAKPTPVQGDLRNLPEALAPLVAMPNWVCWRYERKPNKDGSSRWDKPPVQAKHPDRYAKNNDPATWSSYHDAVESHAAGRCDGIGFNILNSGLVVLDIDDCRDRDTGDIAPEAMQIVHRAATYCEISPSGEGLRVIGLGNGPKLHRNLKVPNSTIAVEVYRACERYFTVTGEPLEGGSFPGGLGNIDRLADDLVRELSSPQEGKVISLDAVRAHADLPPDLRNLISSPTGPDRSADFHRAVCWLGDYGYTTDHIEREIAGQPIVPARYSKRLRQEIERCLRKARPMRHAAATGGVSLDDFHAYMPTHQYIFAPTGEMWPGASVNSRIPPIGSGEQPIVASQWLDKNKAVEQMTWAPGMPQVISGKLMADGGWIEREGLRCFNLYRPPTIKPGNPANAGPWIDHVRKVYGEDAEHLIRWFAHRVQRPQEKINHALVLGGEPGIGKDTMLEPLKHAVGHWNFKEASPTQIMGRFNGFLKAAVLRISETRDHGDHDRFTFYDHTKTMMASPPDVLRVDEKHLREYSVLNVCGVILTTNHKADGIYLPADDRRHFVAWSDLTKGNFPEEYWSRIWGWYGNGGIADVASYLGGLDISGFDAKAPPAKTRVFWEIVDANRAPEDAELADVLDLIGNPEAITLDQLKAEADGETSVWLQDRKNRRIIPHRLERCGYVPIRNEAAEDGLWRVKGKRQVIYAKKTCPPRDQIAAATRLSSR